MMTNNENKNNIHIERNYLKTKKRLPRWVENMVVDTTDHYNKSDLAFDKINNSTVKSKVV